VCVCVCVSVLTHTHTFLYHIQYLPEMVITIGLSPTTLTIDKHLSVKMTTTAAVFMSVLKQLDGIFYSNTVSPADSFRRRSKKHLRDHR